MSEEDIWNMVEANPKDEKPPIDTQIIAEENYRKTGYIDGIGPVFRDRKDEKPPECEFYDMNADYCTKYDLRNNWRQKDKLIEEFLADLKDIRKDFECLEKWYGFHKLDTHYEKWEERKKLVEWTKEDLNEDPFIDELGPKAIAGETSVMACPDLNQDSKKNLPADSRPPKCEKCIYRFYREKKYVLPCRKCINNSEFIQSCSMCDLYGECDQIGAYKKDGKWCYEKPPSDVPSDTWYPLSAIWEMLMKRQNKSKLK